MHQTKTTSSSSLDLLCFSHLRWAFVYQRPQHLMTRFAAHRRVFFIEEPLYESPRAMLRLTVCSQSGVHVVIPLLPSGTPADKANDMLQILLASFLREQAISQYVAWFYTPMALSFADDLDPIATIYDCMDELSLFKGAPPELLTNEAALLDRADLVFTGGVSLYEAKRKRHAHVYPFPSSVDVSHFAQARSLQVEPEDQSNIAHPILGYAGVIDERIDIALLAALAALRPDWQIVLLGPVAKISPDSLPRAKNIHYLGMKNYADLPAYFSSWDAAMLPFALNDATRFISPTKTPEYLAAGLPVISTPIADVIRPYGELGLAQIAATPEAFAAALDRIAAGAGNPNRSQVDAFLSKQSWDKTWSAMNDLIASVSDRKLSPYASSPVSVKPEFILETMDV